MHVLLDLDGTLTDPKVGWLRSLEYALNAVRAEVPPAEALVRWIGPPLPEALATILGPTATEQAADALVQFRLRYAEVGLFENEVYAGIPDALAALRTAGLSLYLATTKPVPYARRILERFGLLPFFAGVYGSELDGTRADKRELIAHVLHAEAIATSAALMVGDREHDVRGARHNGMASLGVLWGYGSRGELEAAGASALCTSTATLAAAVLDCLQGAALRRSRP